MAYLSAGILGLGAVFGHQGRDFGDVGDEIQKNSHLKASQHVLCCAASGNFHFQLPMTPEMGNLTDEHRSLTSRSQTEAAGERRVVEVAAASLDCPLFFLNCSNCSLL